MDLVLLIILFYVVFVFWGCLEKIKKTDRFAQMFLKLTNVNSPPFFLSYSKSELEVVTTVFEILFL